MAGKDPKFPVIAVLVSFPKSGRTWLCVMLNELGLPFDYRHDGSTHGAAHRISEIRVCKKPIFHNYPVVFLTRDPRDTVVSGYFEVTRREKIPYSGTISDFIRDPRHGIVKIILFNKAWLKAGAKLQHFLPITYEQLSADPASALRAIVEFVGGRADDDAISKVVGENTFDKMRHREANREYKQYGTKLAPTHQGDPESYKVRRGKIGGYLDYLSPDDVAYCNAMLERYGYWRPNSSLVESLQSTKLLMQRLVAAGMRRITRSHGVTS